MKHPVILGPVPCRGCRESVYWDGWHWRGVWRHGVHACSNARSIGYNEAAGTSSQSVTIATDADFLLVPGESASLRYEGRD